MHLDVHGLPAEILDRDGFLDALWRELPDASVGGRADIVTITLSQYSVRRRAAARRQASRVQRALVALG